MTKTNSKAQYTLLMYTVRVHGVQNDSRGHGCQNMARVPGRGHASSKMKPMSTSRGHGLWTWVSKNDTHNRAWVVDTGVQNVTRVHGPWDTGVILDTS